jgi:Spy/CpxP family protein refolding chaperone
VPSSFAIQEVTIMRAATKLLLVLTIAALSAGSALGQPGFGGGGPGMLLMNKSVQEELKLDKGQVEKITSAITKVREDHKDDFDKLRDRNIKPEERTDIMKKVTEATTKATAGILKSEQQKRFEQITLQTRGLQAFADSAVQKTLSLTDDQKDKFKTLGEETTKAMRELFQGGFNEETMKKMQELRKESLEKAQKILTEDQRKKFKDMTGEPFQVRFEPPSDR